MSKIKINKMELKKVIREASNLEDAASMLGINRRTLYTLRKEKGLKIKVRG